MQNETILVTGATGRIGRVVIADLLERKFRVRATTSKNPATTALEDEFLEWRQVDFSEETEFAQLVHGCTGVIHLAAELGKKDRMERVNARATERLAKAAEETGVKVFCYASTVSVYGSSLSREVNEASPVLTTTRDVASEYWALDYVRAYGRTKLQGELALRSMARHTTYYILRPTVVVSLSQIINIRDWSPIKRLLGSHRHAHHVFDRDVSDALIWFLQKGLESGRPQGQVDVFNLSEDDRPSARHIDFMKSAYRASRDPRFFPISAPSLFDWLHDFLRFRKLPVRNPLWRMRFSNRKLMDSGYRFRYGMAKAEEQAIEQLKRANSAKMLHSNVQNRPA